MAEFTTKCIQCGGVAVKTKWKNNADNVYYCKRCKGSFGATTHYRRCSKFGYVERDGQGYNDCVLYCSYYKRNKELLDKSGVCVFMSKEEPPYDEIYNSEWYKKRGYKQIEV